MFKGKIALVTGSSRGIGSAIVRRLAAGGAITGIHYARNVEDAARLADAIMAEGGEAFTIGANLESLSGVEAMFDALDDRLASLHLDARLDILVNNAAEFSRARHEDVTEEIFDRVMAVNFKAPFFTIQHALKRMPDGGRIINISSLSAHQALPIYATYGPSKGAMEVMSRTLAQQLGPRSITVNAVAPGLVMSERAASEMKAAPGQYASAVAKIALGRPAEVDDIADVVAFLASDAGRWITGQTIYATGGASL